MTPSWTSAVRAACFALLLTLTTAGLAGLVVADSIQPGDIDARDVVRPVPGAPERGTTMDRTRERLGEPQARRDAVGDPPITRWVYPEFTVYFENDRVIHVVKKHD